MRILKKKMIQTKNNSGEHEVHPYKGFQAVVRDSTCILSLPSNHSPAFSRNQKGVNLRFIKFIVNKQIILQEHHFACGEILCRGVVPAPEELVRAFGTRRLLKNLCRKTRFLQLVIQAATQQHFQRCSA
jgi:hypothetical protein